MKRPYFQLRTGDKGVCFGMRLQLDRQFLA